MTYQYKECEFIKVEVEFDDHSSMASEDKIIRISRPYLEKPNHSAD